MNWIYQMSMVLLVSEEWSHLKFLWDTKKIMLYFLSLASRVHDPPASSQSLLISPQCRFHPLLIASVEHKFFPHVFLPLFPSFLRNGIFVLHVSASVVFPSILFPSLMTSQIRISSVNLSKVTLLSGMLSSVPHDEDDIDNTNVFSPLQRPVIDSPQ